MTDLNRRHLGGLMLAGSAMALAGCAAKASTALSTCKIRSTGPLEKPRLCRKIQQQSRCIAPRFPYAAVTQVVREGVWKVSDDSIADNQIEMTYN